jgi:hypothetical protein
MTARHASTIPSARGTSVSPAMRSHLASSSVQSRGEETLCAMGFRSLPARIVIPTKLAHPRLHWLRIRLLAARFLPGSSASSGQPWGRCPGNVSTKKSAAFASATARLSSGSSPGRKIATGQWALPETASCLRTATKPARATDDFPLPEEPTTAGHFAASRLITSANGFLSKIK